LTKLTISRVIVYSFEKHGLGVRDARVVNVSLLKKVEVTYAAK